MGKFKPAMIAAITALCAATGASAADGDSQTGRAARPDREAFKAAAAACGLPKPGEGRPTTEQEACMANAGFTKPAHGPGGGRHDRRPPRDRDESAAPPEAEPATFEQSSEGGSSRTVQ